MPLPPYIKERLEDPDRYQTVYERKWVSSSANSWIAFYQRIVDEIEAKGVELVY